MTWLGYTTVGEILTVLVNNLIMNLENFTTKCWENVKNGDMLLERIVFFRGDLALITQG